MNQPAKNNKNIEQVNYDIRAREVLIILDDGSKIGPLGRNEAIRIAKEKGLDLLLVSATSNPPIAKLVDYGKYKYEQKKKNKENKKNQHVTENKEMRLRTGIGDHDLEFKAKKVREFLLDRNRVKISLKFRGREVARPEYGKETLDKFFSYIDDLAKIEKEPQLNGLFLDMYIVPKKIN
ncbi:translation initiation factor IF-3 [Spiroplasma endosymbiont of Polydrusus formosus]|uniref:translation initiation factor IF-3 n=1 Tax=Spiroplasma endosymbiont of Polydrusus formosus TaxID=3139326 RepID=UPI0035B540E6